MIPRGGFGGVEKYLVFSEDDETGTGKAGFVQRLAYSESVVVKTSEGEETFPDLAAKYSKGPEKNSQGIGKFIGCI